jgi:hypothetical protein
VTCGQVKRRQEIVNAVHVATKISQASARQISSARRE